jgi:hypothetical protein
MYPRTWFDTYWRGTLRPEVFVAMSFADEFAGTWENSVRPAIEDDLAGGKKYRAHRVDITTLSGSIVTEVFDGVAHATLVFADISTMGVGAWAGQRNGNVMYEVGLATAIRPETDLVLVKSDDASINFDLLQIRVHTYPRENPHQARQTFAKLLTAALAARERAKSLLARHAWSLLDRDYLSLMWKRRDFQPFGLPKAAEEGDRYAIRRLLELGVIRCECPAPCEYRYVWPGFGRAVFANPNEPVLSDTATTQIPP